MSPPTIYELCRPRADALQGRIRDEDFAADLSQVLKGTAPGLYKNPALFFANTHPTRGLRELSVAVVDRLTGAGSQLGSILWLDTSYGGGKGSLGERSSKKCEQEDLLFPSLGARRIRQDLDRFLWKEDKNHVSARKLGVCCL